MLRSRAASCCKRSRAVCLPLASIGKRLIKSLMLAAMLFALFGYSLELDRLGKGVEGPCSNQVSIRGAPPLPINEAFPRLAWAG